MPNNETEWKQIAHDFKTMWDFDHCLGAIDGKHILINKPPNSGFFFYNYKGTFSVVLFAVVNSNYEFIYGHSGINGRVSDGGVLKKTDLHRLLLENNLKIPSPQPLIQNQYELPYVFIGDEAFPLMENIMKPYSENCASHDEHIFNYRLSRARRVVENAFGILAARFRVFLQPLNIDIKNLDAVVMASCVLHNFLQKNSANYYTSLNQLDTENVDTGNIMQGQWHQIGEMVPLQRSLNYSNRSAKSVRDKFKQNFNNEGKVSFEE